MEVEDRNRKALDHVFAQRVKDWQCDFADGTSTDVSGEIVSNCGEGIRFFRSDTMVRLHQPSKLA